MKTEKNILIVFILNLAFSIFEFIGGIYTGSVAIVSDAVHDIGDATSIGMSYLMEKKSKKQPDEKYTYGYARYSVIGAAITILILMFSSITVIVNALDRIINPTVINYNGMIDFAVIGVAVNFGAALLSREGASLNQKAVNLHMLEDVLGWVVVLVGAIVMRFTNYALIDPIMSIGVAAFIFANALKNLKELIDIFLEKTPRGVEVNVIREHIADIDGVLGVHHIHIWSMNGNLNCATMHIVINSDSHHIKEKVREELREHGIIHATLELETSDEQCHEEYCHMEIGKISCGHHHHH